MKRYALIVLIIGFIAAVKGQTVADSSNISTNKNREIIDDGSTAKINLSGYTETYFQFETSLPKNNSRPAFVYSHNRNNEVNLNLAFIKASYSTQKQRSNLALATGTYMNANYSAEPGLLKSIYEANIGLKVSRKYNLWVDAGIFPSHIGFESAIGKDNWTLTRSLMADNSPYFETGAKITYTTPSSKWQIVGLILNGWQRIQRVDGNTTPALGHQLFYKPNDKFTFNSSSFIGNDKPDSVKQMRYFHNLYAIYQISPKLALTAGFDFGTEQKERNSEFYNNWYTLNLIGKYSATSKLSISGRVEYYEDKNGVIIASEDGAGFKTLGYSANIDYQISPNMVWRVEAKNLIDKNESSLKSSNFSTATALAISF